MAPPINSFIMVLSSPKIEEQLNQPSLLAIERKRNDQRR
jgi:hypothetical protein